MNYVIAGYTIVLTILFLYGLQLVWRRRRLTRTATGWPRPTPGSSGPGTAPMTSGPPVGPDARRCRTTRWPAGPPLGRTRGRPPAPLR